MNFGQRVYDFYSTLNSPGKLPEGVEVMNPYTSSSVKSNVKNFLDSFFSDNNERTFVFGINPGRFGAGITGVTFTDPVALNKYCLIPNNLPQKRELSSDFIYQFVEHYGGVKKFYQQFFLTAISPLGFVKNGINYNYYDDKELLRATLPYIVDSTNKQLALGANRKAAIILGRGKNQKVFTDLNKKHGFFENIYALEHPRFIMQYRRKFIPEYLKKYNDVFSEALNR